MTDLELAKLLTYDFNSGEQWFLDTCLRAGLSMPNAKFAVKACFESKGTVEGDSFFRGAQLILQLVGAQPGTRAALEGIAKARGLIV